MGFQSLIGHNITKREPQAVIASWYVLAKVIRSNSICGIRFTFQFTGNTETEEHVVIGVCGRTKPNPEETSVLILQQLKSQDNTKREKELLWVELGPTEIHLLKS
jgi:hypothetical protein